MKVKFYYIIAGLLLLTACGQSPANIENKPLAKVETVTAMRRSLHERLRVFGEVKSEDEILLSSQFSGRIVSLNVLPGDKVKKGELIAKIRRKGAEAVSTFLKNEFKDISVYSPAVGSVVQKYVSRGDVVTGGQPIVKIIAKGGLYLLLDLAPEYYDKVKIGDKVEFTVNGKKYNGHIKAKSAAVDSSSGTLKVRASIGQGGILPGVFVDAYIITAAKSCVTVPRNAVITRDNRQFIFVVKNATAHIRYIKTGRTTEEYAEIQGELSPGEEVVVLGNYELEDGASVVVIPRASNSTDTKKAANK